ncbi:sensor histidine kinase [Pseudoduganella sp. GCM10020061]|uniref:sensor histidine kinase n=1 Tax=Pseudoduganella sp. GCM10020061 TaxID=3317345 RepID=UPI0036459F55
MSSSPSTVLDSQPVPSQAVRASASHRRPAGASNRDYWLCQLAGWGGLAVFSVLTSIQDMNEEAFRFALAKTSCMVSGLFLSHLWRQFLLRRGWIDRNGAFPVRQILGALAVISVVQTGFLVVADIVFRHGALLTDPEIWFLLPFLVLLWFAIFMVWTLCYAMVLSRRRALRFELEKLELEVSIKDAELRALQAQVNPHFFFNSLNSIRALIYQDADAAAKAVSQLGGIMRHSLRAGQVSTVRLADEMAAVNAYLGMETIRFESRLHLTIGIEPGLDDVALPPMALQTLVENAVKHGVEPSMGVCEIRIAARRDGEHVVLSVANQGWLAEASASTRLGLANTSKRLALLFGPGATCTLAEQDGWVIATITLPQVQA